MARAGSARAPGLQEEFTVAWLGRGLPSSSANGLVLRAGAELAATWAPASYPMKVKLPPIPLRRKLRKHDTVNI